MATQVKQSGGVDSKKKVSILDLKKQYQSIKQEVDDVLKNVIVNQNFVLGKDVSSLEEEIAKYSSTKYAVGVASGTDALILALKALGIGSGDEVITTPFTFFATAESISIVGAKPVFVDIDPQAYNINPGLIEKAVTSRTKAIIPVHLYGQCVDMDPILAVARKHKLKVIEDTAQAIGATYKTRKAGSMADIGAMSFFPSKNLGAFGDGGMVVTNDNDLAQKIRMLRVHGSDKRYIHSEIGMNSRLDNLQAAVLRIKLKYLDGWLEARRKNALYFNQKLRNLPVVCPYVPEHNVHTYHLYVIRVHERMAELSKYLNDNGIEARTYYPVPLHKQDCYLSLGYKDGDFREAEKAARETLSFAVYPELEEEQKEYIATKIKDFFEEKK